jgi:hypothetical protein
MGTRRDSEDGHFPFHGDDRWAGRLVIGAIVASLGLLPYLVWVTQLPAPWDAVGVVGPWLAILAGAGVYSRLNAPRVDR